jgi:hypothetical protein
MKADQADQVFLDRCAAIVRVDAEQENRRRFKHIPVCAKRVVGGLTVARRAVSNSEEERAAAKAGASRMLNDGF